MKVNLGRPVIAIRDIGGGGVVIGVAAVAHVLSPGSGQLWPGVGPGSGNFLPLLWPAA